MRITPLSNQPQNFPRIVTRQYSLMVERPSGYDAQTMQQQIPAIQQCASNPTYGASAKICKY